MGEREAADKRPNCPICNYPDAARLAPIDALYRWQCRNHDCLHQWTTPRERLTPLLDAARESRRQPTADEVVAMAKQEKSLKCQWCGKGYAHQARLETHETDCEKIGRSGEKPARKPKAAPSSTAPVPIVDEVPEHMKGSAIEPAFQQLLNRRQALNDEAAEVNRALATLSKLQPAETASRPI